MIDVERTFPMLAFFQRGGPQHEVLRCLLEAYTLYQPDIGYVSLICLKKRKTHTTQFFVSLCLFDNI
jgi:hypothetical protein